MSFSDSSGLQTWGDKALSSIPMFANMCRGLQNRIDFRMRALLNFFSFKIQILRLDTWGRVPKLCKNDIQGWVILELGSIVGISQLGIMHSSVRYSSWRAVILWGWYSCHIYFILIEASWIGRRRTNFGTREHLMHRSRPMVSSSSIVLVMRIISSANLELVNLAPFIHAIRSRSISSP